VRTEGTLLASESQGAPGDARSGEGRRPSLPTWTAVAAALTAFAVLVPAGPGAKALATVGIIVVPGAAIISLLDLALDGLARRLFFTLVTGIAFLMGIGLVSAFALRLVGIDHPLTRGPMLVVWLLVLITSVLLPARRQRDPLRMVLDDARLSHCWWLLGLGVLPALALVGAARLNAGHGGALAVFVCVACVGVLLLVLVSTAWDRALIPSGPAIFMSVVALVWQQTARGNWLFGSDIQHEYFVANQAASTGQYSLAIHGDPYRLMLSLTVLPAQLHALTSASVEMLLQLLPATILGLVVIGALCVFRSLVSEGLAVGFTLLFVGVSSALLTELPSVTRQCYGLLMFVAMVVLVVAPPLPIRRTRALFVALGVAMVLAHYSTAFIGIPVLVVGWVFGVRFSSATAADEPTWADDKATRSLILGRGRTRRRRGRILVIGSLVVVLLGAIVVSTRSQLSHLRKSIGANGLGLLPGHGGLLSRWIHGAGSNAISATALQQYDQTHTTDRIAHYVDPRSLSYHLTNASAPKRPSVPVLAPISSASVTIANELILLASLIGVVVCVVWLIRRKHHLRPELVGMAVGAVAIDAVARLSGSVAQSFGPERVQAQLGIVLLIPLAMIVGSVAWGSSRKLRCGVILLAMIELVSTTGLLSMAFGGVPPASLSTNGENVERFVVTAPSLFTARWVVDHAGARAIQADTYGALVLSDFTGGERPSTFSTVDPRGVYRFAWVYATPANIVDGRARGTANNNVGVFAFPQTFYDGTRPVLFTTGTTKVYGQVALGH
jgi:hypothetical protein